MGRRSLIDRMLVAWPADADMSQADLARAAGISQGCVSRYIATLHSERKVHISDWRRAVNPTKQPMALYRLGPGTDVPCYMKPKGNALSVREYRERQRKSGEWEHRKARARAAHWANNPRPHPLTAAFFGVSK